MSLLQSARRLDSAFKNNTGLALQGYGEHRACRVCKERLTYYENAPAQRNHKPDCPVLALPRIVVALELLAEFADYANWVGGGEYDGKRGMAEAREILGIDPPEDDDDD